jgi:hypothetical protein
MAVDDLKARIDRQIGYLKGWQWETPLQDTGNLVKEINYLNWLAVELYRAQRLYKEDKETQQRLYRRCNSDNNQD